MLTDGRTTDGRTTDAGVTGILIAHLGAFGSGELKIPELQQGYFSPFWEFDRTPRIGNFSRLFKQNWENLTPYNIIK